MMNSAILKWIAWVLVMIGGINWGLYGLFRLNLIQSLIGMGFLERIIFILIGVAAGFLIYRAYVQKKI